VTVRTSEGELTREVPNPVGDAAYHPFGEPEVLALLSALLGDPHAVGTVRDVVAELPGADDATPILARLAL
jgi:hypothetical protein